MAAAGVPPMSRLGWAGALIRGRQPRARQPRRRRAGCGEDQLRPRAAVDVGAAPPLVLPTHAAGAYLPGDGHCLRADQLRVRLRDHLVEWHCSNGAHLRRRRAGRHRAAGAAAQIVPRHPDRRRGGGAPWHPRRRDEVCGHRQACGHPTRRYRHRHLLVRFRDEHGVDCPRDADRHPWAESLPDVALGDQLQDHDGRLHPNDAVLPLPGLSAGCASLGGQLDRAARAPRDAHALLPHPRRRRWTDRLIRGGEC
mmetsp:Transcript_32041/g.79809  ORF Transcript_32041/g.79809 Transcript_32041/m.79809 type:complete len:253 (-) Transcript_32041:569-1327(-)